MGHRAMLWIVVAVLAVHNVAGNLWWPQWAYVPLNVAVVAVLLLAASRVVPADEIWGRLSEIPRGALVGLAGGVGLAVFVGVAAAVPAAQDLFADDRVLGVGSAGLAYRMLVRIPLGTALFEETAFRGLLPALGRGITTSLRANLLAAGLFGLWHVLPLMSVSSGNEAASGLATPAVVIAGVGATALVGLAFSWMRDRWGLAAPIVLHAVVNAAALGIAWAVT